MFDRLKRMMGGRAARDGGDDTAADPGDAGGPLFDWATLAWVPADDNPFGVEIIDLRPFTGTMMSTTTNPDIATMFVRMTASLGEEFRGVAPREPGECSCELVYRLDPDTEEGVLFIAQEMEDKWCAYVWGDRISFVRSWSGEVGFVAHTRREGHRIVITRIDGGLPGRDDDDDPDRNAPDMIARHIDYLMKALVLGEIAPVPLPASMPRDPELITLTCFSQYGRAAMCASYADDRPRRPETPFRADSLLHVATERGDVDAVRAQLAAGAGPSARGRYAGMTPVHAAATFGHLEILELLIDAGADLERRTDDGGLTPLLFIAAREDVSTDALRMLLDRGADIDGRSTDGSSALHFAVQASGREDVVRFLIERGLGPDVRSGRGFTPLHIAAETALVEMVRGLLEAGADVAAEAEGHTPRSLAEAKGHTEIVRMLDDAPRRRG